MCSRPQRPRETVVLQPQQGKEEEEQVAWQEEPPVKRNRPNPQAESDAAQQPLGPAQPSGGLNVRSSSAPLVQLVAQGQPVPQHASHGLGTPGTTLFSLHSAESSCHSAPTPPSLLLGSHALAPLPQPQLLTQSYAHHGGLPGKHCPSSPTTTTKAHGKAGPLWMVCRSYISSPGVSGQSPGVGAGPPGP